MKEQKPHALHGARLAAVQGLYQMGIADTSLEDVILQFESGESKRPRLSKKGRAHFESLLRGVSEMRDSLKKSLEARLSQSWKWERMDMTLRAILLAGAYEMIHLKEAPPAAIIDEYVELAHAFFDDPLPGAVNGILDSLSRGEGEKP